MMASEKLESAEQLAARHYATVDEEQPTQSMREHRRLIQSDRRAVLEWVAKRFVAAFGKEPEAFDFIISLKQELP